MVAARGTRSGTCDQSDSRPKETRQGDVDGLDWRGLPAPELAAALLARGRDVVERELDALRALLESLDQPFARACTAILAMDRQLVVTGMGKSGHIARKVAATFAATGTPAVFMHPAEAAHGDMGVIAPGDVLLVLSNSGNTAELLAVLDYARSHAIPVIGVAARQKSRVIASADFPILLPAVLEACSANVAPTASTTMQLCLGDALAMAVMDARGIANDTLRDLHPAGAIGVALTPVRAIMQGQDRIPLVSLGAAMPHTLSVMTAGCFGLAGVVNDEGRLCGVITDGDVRRHFDGLAKATAADVMTGSPKVLSAHTPAGEALAFLNSNEITAAFVVQDATGGPHRPLGIIHIHDLLRHGLD